MKHGKFFDGLLFSQRSALGRRVVEWCNRKLSIKTLCRPISVDLTIIALSDMGLLDVKKIKDLLKKEDGYTHEYSTQQPS